MPVDKKYLLKVISGEELGLKASLIRVGLSTLELLYDAGLTLYLASEKIGLRKRKRLSAPVISIGNLSVGGSGKTPMTQFLAEKLLDKGRRPAILSRGHGGTITPESAVISAFDGVLRFGAMETGDEAALLALSLPGIPVVVGKDRAKSGKMALELPDVDLLLLDDGFQYWQLYRDLDIVLLDSAKPFDNDHALPRGLLREPKRNLKRAGVVVFTRSKDCSESERRTLRQSSQRIAPFAPVFFADHVFDGVVSLNEIARVQKPQNAFAACGIGQPASFAKTIGDAGIEIAGEPLALDDHQEYTPALVAQIEDLAKASGASCIVVTEKDAVKLNSAQFELPLYAIRIKMAIDDEVRFWKALSERIG
jgi:tetraacyldisaccharide 4'-kinase